MTTDWRALCADLAAELERCRPLAEVPDCLARARAALAVEAVADGPTVPESREPASVAGEPSDEELAQAAKAAIHEYKYPTELVYFLNSDSSEYEPFLLALRAVIAADRARWSHQPDPPAEGELGELGELVAWLREQATWFAADDPDHKNYDRAADLLSIAFATGAEAWEPIPRLPAQHQAAPVPAEALIQAYQAGRRDAEADAQQAAEAADQDEPAEGEVGEMTDTRFNALYPQREYAPGPEPLSSAAQAVLDAAYAGNAEGDVIGAAAAALRAAADQGENIYDSHEGKVSVVRIEQLFAIAAELEGHHG